LSRQYGWGERKLKVSLTDYFSQFLREKMEEKGYNTISLARKLGVSPSTVSRWITWKEEERLMPSPVMLSKIAKVLNLDDNEIKEILSKTRIFPTFEITGAFPPEPEFLSIILKDGDRNLYEDRLKVAYYLYMFVEDVLNYFFIINGKELKNEFLEIYLHVETALAYLDSAFHNLNSFKDRVEKIEKYVNTENFPEYYFFYKFYALYNNLYPKNTKEIIEKIEKEAIKYNGFDKERPIYLYRKEILVPLLKTYRASVSSSLSEVDTLISSAIDELDRNSKTLYTKGSILNAWGNLIVSYKNDKTNLRRAINLCEEALKMIGKMQREFEKKGAWSESNKSLISHLPLKYNALISLAKLYLRKKDFDGVQHYAKEGLIIAEKLGIEHNIKEARKLLNQSRKENRELTL
jgi:transcriptional regulator with XRE-family HTH domain